MLERIWLTIKLAAEQCIPSSALQDPTAADYAIAGVVILGMGIAAAGFVHGIRGRDGASVERIKSQILED